MSEPEDRARFTVTTHVEGGVGQTCVAVIGTVAEQNDLTYNACGDGWSVRGLRLAGLARILCEVQERSALHTAALGEALVTGMSGVTTEALAVVGPDAAALQAQLHANMAASSCDTQQWLADIAVSNDLYTEVEFRVAATLPGNEAVLLASLTHGLLGRRHHTPLLSRVRHRSPIAYSVRTIVIDLDGQLCMRVRVGGRPASHQQRRRAVREVLDAPLDMCTMAALFAAVQVGLRTEVALGGDPGASALELLHRLDAALAHLEPEQAAIAASDGWAALEWVESDPCSGAPT